MNPSTVSLQMSAASANAIALSQSPGAAGNLTLNGASVSGGVATLSPARRVIITSGGNDSGKTFTIYGTTRSGQPQSETLAGGNIAAVQSVFDYLTVTRVAISAASAGTVTVGTNTVASSDWVQDDPYKSDSSWAVTVAIYGAAGTTYTLEFTLQDANGFTGESIVGAQQWSMAPGGEYPPRVMPVQSVVGASGNTAYSFPSPVMYHRFTILTGTGLVIMDSLQSGVR